MLIHIWTPRGELLELNDLNSWDSVADLQGRLAVLADIPAQRQKLTFRGRRLEKNRILVEYGIHEHHNGVIIIEFEESEHSVFESNESVRADDSNIGSLLLLDGPQNLDSLRHSSDYIFKDFGAKQATVSEISTCAPSECASDCGDAEITLPSASLRDAFVEANSAHVAYLLMRRQRLEAAGLGLRTLCSTHTR
jgi:hypothetical protein